MKKKNYSSWNQWIIFDDVEIAKIFKNYINKVVGDVDINRNLEYVQEPFDEDPVLVSIEKYATYPCIETLKAEWIALIQISLLNFLINVKFLKTLKS